LLRILRVWRLIRDLSTFDRLRTLIRSIVKSSSALLWLLTVLIMLTYVFSIIVTRIVTHHKMLSGHENVLVEELQIEDKFGTLDRTMVILYMAISEGVHWGELSDPLAEFISPSFHYLFMIYTSLIFFAVMNVMTANLFESVMAVGGRDTSTCCRQYFVSF